MYKYASTNLNELLLFQVYQGSAQQCKISKLQENTTYNFSISASNAAGEGPRSSLLAVTTLRAPPQSLKGKLHGPLSSQATIT